ncbi:MAG TPA: hydrogenase expression/formation protein HypE, partial [Firmicutes bacterium]|nr:hydrogenase expression/formation protein HypE [Bacillota bacterium]
MRHETIMLAHGSGGRRMHDLIRTTIGHILIRPEHTRYSDSAVLGISNGRVAFTTDTYV